MATSPLLSSPLSTSRVVAGGGGGEAALGDGGGGGQPGPATVRLTENGAKREEDVSSSSTGVHKCQYCAKHYSSSHSLRTHEKWHRGDLGHPCSHCDKKFRNPSEVRRHEMTHTGEKPHKCPYCPTKFIQKVCKTAITKTINTSLLRGNYF